MKFLMRLFVFLLIVGFIMIGVAFLGDMDINRLTSVFDQSEAYGDPIHYTENESIDHLVIDVTVKHIAVTFTDLETLKVTYYSHTDDIWEITSELGVLTIKQTQKIRPLIGFYFGFVDHSYTTLGLEIPKDWVMDFDLSTNTGDISLFGTLADDVELLVAGNVKLETNTGHIEVKDLSAPSIELKSDTGDIAVLNLFVTDHMKITNSTGVIHLEDSTGKSVDITGSTGRIEVENLQIYSLDIDSDTSRIELRDSEIETSINVEISTGKIIVENVSAISYDLRTDTGDIEVELISLESMKFDLNTNLGKIIVDGVNQGDRHVTTIGTIDFVAETTTGNITINVRD
ncbi:MAG: DUF4097 family beta strand repeat-containing protein [Acholeplasmataceae bacterium]|nr:DUF4097 family beta strand repeat protein [Acholeplasmataceae bacterium]